MNFRSEVLLGLRWVAGTKVLGQLFTWAVTVVVVRILTSADYGLLAMASVFIAFLMMLAQFGVGFAMVQAAEIDERKLRQMLGLAVAVNLALFGATYFAAPLIAEFFTEPRLVAIVRVLSVQYVLMIFAVIPSATLSRNLDYKKLSLIEMAAALVASLTTLALALAGAGVWALVCGSLVAALCRTAALNIVSPFLAWPVFSFRGVGKLLYFGGNITAARILWFVYSQSDVIIAGRLLGKELLGFYSIAMNLASFPADKLSAIVNQVSFPAFARIQGDRERYAASFLLAVRLLSFAVFPVLWGISSIALELVPLLLGSHWLPAAVPLQLLALIMPVHMFAPFMSTAAQGIGRADLALKQVALASLVMPLAFVVGSQWGLLGLAVAWVAAFPLVFVWAMVLFLPVIGLRIRDFLGAMARPMLASLGMYATVGAARIMLGPVMSPIARMTLLIVVGVAVYAVLTLLVNRGGYREMRGMLRR